MPAKPDHPAPAGPSGSSVLAIVLFELALPGLEVQSEHDAYV